MADYISKDRDVAKLCKRCERLYPIGTVIDILISDIKLKDNKEQHLFYTVHKGSGKRARGY
jgi:hypothetical protein